MYLRFYGLAREPFNITPDPDFLFLGESHKQALGSIIYAVDHRKGFLAITGAVGVGKTTIVRSYLEQSHDSRLKVIYLFNPVVSFAELLGTMYESLGLETNSDSVSELVNRLHLALIEEYNSGNNVALIIDEAQNIPVDTIENLRMLSNLETVKDKLIQILLIGQPEFDEVLERNDLRQVRQRISVRTAIAPLTDKESLAYIGHRLARAGLRSKPIFTKGALKRIIRQAKGIPRTINILCDNALVTGFGYQKNPIPESVVKEVISDFRGTKKFSDRPSYGGLRWKWGVGTACLFILCFLFFYVVPRPISGPAKEAPVSAPANPAVVMAPPSQEGAPPQSKDGSVPPQVKDESVPPPEKKEDVVIQVKKGDTLIRLIQQAYDEETRTRYGFKELLALVRESNPDLKDANRVVVGRSLVFPGIGTKEAR